MKGFNNLSKVLIVSLKIIVILLIVMAIEGVIPIYILLIAALLLIGFYAKGIYRLSQSLNESLFMPTIRKIKK